MLRMPTPEVHRGRRGWASLPSWAYHGLTGTKPTTPTPFPGRRVPRVLGGARVAVVAARGPGRPAWAWRGRRRGTDRSQALKGWELDRPAPAVPAHAMRPGSRA